MKMKKMVEIEYIGIEDIQDIMDDAYALMSYGHYVNFQMSNFGKIHIGLSIMLDGFDNDRLYDYDYDFYMTEDSRDVKTMNDCKNTLKNLIIEEENDNEAV